MRSKSSFGAPHPPFPAIKALKTGASRMNSRLRSISRQWLDFPVYSRMRTLVRVYVSFICIIQVR
jgi:hypothetical protein